MTTQRDTQSSRDTLIAIALMVASVTMFSALDASAKYLATREGLPVVQVAWVRFLGQFLILLVFVPALGIMPAKALFKTKLPGWQSIRSLLMAAATFFNFLAVESLRLDQTVTIAFLAPLVVALLAGPFLGEWVGWRRLVAILVGFAGVLIAVRPGFASVEPAMGWAFSAMMVYASFMLVTRHISGIDPPVVTLFYSMFAGTALAAPFALYEWTMPANALTWVLLASLGLCGGFGHYLFIHAYSRAPASTVSPFLYFQLLSMVGFGYVVFGDIPDWWTLAGAAVIIASGVYLVHREHVSKQQQ